ncbi:MAG: WXG100 family type VII secretion target [Rhodopirellula sp.]|nr:WXG100 family type VII secretion target [Rhodopirellula sp.]
MPQAIVDPDDLRRFAQNLKKFNMDVQDRITTLNSQVLALGSTWRDQENKKFVAEFEQQVRVIAKFVELTNEHIPYLLRKAEAIEQYLSER